VVGWLGGWLVMCVRQVVRCSVGYLVSSLVLQVDWLVS